MRFFYSLLFCTCVVAVYSLPVLETPACGDWSDWTGECSFDHCGTCSVQTRTREVGPGCEGPDIKSRNCVNSLCLFPCRSCAPGCQKKIFDKTFVCSAGAITPNDVANPIPAVPGHNICSY